MSAVMTKEERRDFSRIALSRPATLELGGKRSACELVDISLRGALVRGPAGLQAAVGQPCRLVVHLDAGAATIQMHGAVAHFEETVGVRCEAIDLDSIAHLRRLLEMNLGDERLLHRELLALVAHGAGR